MKTGFYRIKNDEYHAMEGLSKSGISKILRSPAHFKAPTGQTPAMELGQAFHTYILERDKFDKQYTVYPADCLAGKGMKARKEDFEAENADKQIISHNDFQNIQAMAIAVHNHPKAAELLQDGEAEVSGFWQDPIDGVLCKLRADWINKGQMFFVDLKSCMDARPWEFGRVAYNLGYHLQAGWYLYGATQITRIEHHDFYFIAVEKVEPYGVHVYRASEEFIQKGLIDCARAIPIYKACLESGEWPNYGQETLELELPGWVKRSGNSYG